MLAPTYTIRADAPPPMPWDDYANLVTAEYVRLINLGNTPEAELQGFLERNPSFVPGAWTPGVTSGHTPFLSAVISQPTLCGTMQFQPDFLWISTHSLEWFPTFVEIERPNKRTFKGSKLEVTSFFAQARNQLAQWRTWFDEPANCQTFVERFRIPDLLRNRKMTLHFVLVYGRRGEFEGNRQKTRHRANLQDQGTTLVSLDRLMPIRESANMMTVRLGADGRVKCVAVPPTFRLGPNIADDLLLIEDIEPAIERNDLISLERRAFLNERLEYWRNWSRSNEPHVIGGGPCWE